MVTVKSRDEIERMRRAGRIVADVLALCEEQLKPGITTARLDALAEDYIRKAGAKPSFKGYHGFPASICVSIDDEVVHGIPGERTIKEGQVVSVDAGAIWQGFHGDGARTFYVGSNPPSEIDDLITTTRLALMAGVAACTPGNRIADISAAVESVALGKFGIVRQYVGHGIGTQMHEQPQVPNYSGGPRGMELKPGICLAIEPMLTLGTHDEETRPDGWTVVTRDHSLAAHFEHTVAVTDHGPEILTTV